MREAVGRALISSDLSTYEHESAIDRVGALAHANKLGRALWHWAVALDESAARTAYKALLKKAQRRVRVYQHHRDHRLLERVVTMVLYEWRYQGCLTCGGAGQLIDEEKKLKLSCVTCDGSGKRRYSDGERMASLNIDAFTYRKWERNIHEIWLCLTGSDVGAGIVCRFQLERA